MTIEDRLRRAIDTRTSAVEPSDDGLERITEKVLEQGKGQPKPWDVTRNRWFLAAAATVLVGAVVAGLAVGRGDSHDKLDTADDERRDRTTTTDEPSTTSTTTEATTSTTAASGSATGPGASTSTTTATTTAPAGPAVPQDVLDQAIWPRPSSDVRFDDPAAAARSFALYYVRFAAPVVGAYRAGDSSSGEVPVKPIATGPETTVLVRRLSDGNWYVTGATTANIVVDVPAGGAALSCPLGVSGRALAFEGTVDVRIDAYQPDGDRVTLGSGFVTGSGSPPAGPFDGSIACSGGADGVESRAVVRFSTADQGEATGTPGSTWEATVLSLAL